MPLVTIVFSALLLAVGPDSFRSVGGKTAQVGPTLVAARVGLPVLARHEATTNSVAVLVRQRSGGRLTGPVIGGLIGGAFGIWVAETLGRISDIDDGPSTLSAFGIGAFAGAVIGALIAGSGHK